MMICTNCGHTNPEGATHCEACYAELPKMTLCSSCQADVPEDALFCSQCGAQLQPELQMGSDDLAMAPTNVVPPVDPLAPTNVSANDPAMSQVPPTDVMELESRATGQVPATDLDDPYIPPSPINAPDGLNAEDGSSPDLQPTVVPSETEWTGSTPDSEPDEASAVNPAELEAAELEAAELEAAELESVKMPEAAEAAELPVESTAPPVNAPAMTQIQQSVAQLLHVRSDTTLELPPHLDVIHIGKPNERIPPDIDVAGFPDSEVVSRVHADIRVEPNGYYLEDANSSNGTYVNNQPLRPGDRYLLRSGDRISLGKEDKVSFIFQAQ